MPAIPPGNGLPAGWIQWSQRLGIFCSCRGTDPETMALTDLRCGHETPPLGGHRRILALRRLCRGDSGRGPAADRVTTGRGLVSRPTLAPRTPLTRSTRRLASDTGSTPERSPNPGCLPSTSSKVHANQPETTTFPGSQSRKISQFRPTPGNTAGMGSTRGLGRVAGAGYSGRQARMDGFSGPVAAAISSLVAALVARITICCATITAIATGLAGYVAGAPAVHVRASHRLD